MKLISKLLVLLLIVSMVLPVQAWEQSEQFRLADPLEGRFKPSNGISVQSEPAVLQHPSKWEIAEKWKTVTSASTIFAEAPSVSAPYAAGELSENFLESGLTYLNYVRFVAGLPAVRLDAALNENAQHGAVLLAAIDELTHYPSQPADMDDAFYNEGYSATTSSNISARWGYSNKADMLKSSVSGCMNDVGSLTNLTTVGHRRWLLNPALGNVGFGYAESETGASYIVTKVFDWSGTGCDFDFIAWPANGNHPMHLFNFENPWSVTLNSNIYDYASVDNIKVTITRGVDGEQLVIDASSGDPESATPPYVIVNHSGYGLPNCIIFRPNYSFFSYENSDEDVFQVQITGIHYANGTPAELNYTVDFFDLEAFIEEGNLDVPEVEISNVSSTGKIKLTWEAVDGASKYKVYRSTDKENWTLLKTTTGTSLTNAAITAGELYYYYVVAVAEDGTKSEPSEVVSRTCDLPCPVVTLSNVASSGKIKISWEAIDGAVKYKVYYSTDKENWTLLKTTTGTSLTHSSTEAGKLYDYKVMAIASNSAANSAFSTVKSRTCDLPCPAVTLSNNAATGKIKISWNAIEGAVKYQLYRSTNNEDWTLLKTTTGTSLTNTSTTAGELYYYKVKAIASNSAANSAFSTVKSRTCDLARPVVTLDNSTAGKIKISWAAIDGAVKYKVYRSTDGETWTLLKTTTGTKLTNAGLTSGTVYYYKVRAIASTSAANSAYSTVKSVTPG